MRIAFVERGVIQVDNARITYRNFSGEGTKFNREGDRNFALIIDDEDIANALEKEGWNVKIKPPREEGDMPFMYLPVKVKFNDRGPRVYLETGRKRNRLDEESIDCLDNIDIADVSLDIRPYHWEVQDKQGTTAYLQSMLVVQDIDRFASRFAEEEHPEE